MTGSDKVEMTINIGGEILKLFADFNRQDDVRDAESAVRQYFNKMRKSWPEMSDTKILAMAAYQFAYWRQELLNLQNDACSFLEEAEGMINSCLSKGNSVSEDALTL